MSKGLYPYTQIYLDEAKKLGLDSRVLVRPSLVEISNSHNSTRIHQSKTQLNDAIATQICRNKRLTYFMLKKAGIPTPTQHQCFNIKQVAQLTHKLNFPLVIKPKMDSFGRGVNLNINSQDALFSTAKRLLSQYSSILIENQCSGQDFRVVILNQKIIAVVKREPPWIVGNGQSTIRQLSSYLPKIRLDQELQNTLTSQKVSLDTIPTNNKKIYLRANANGSSGGFSTTLPIDYIHPSIQSLAIKTSQLLGTNLVGLDLLIKDPKQKSTNNVTVIEANDAPGLGIHYHPTHGQIQPIAKIILKHIFQL